MTDLQQQMTNVLDTIDALTTKENNDQLPHLWASQEKIQATIRALNEFDRLLSETDNDDQ